VRVPRLDPGHRPPPKRRPKPMARHLTLVSSDKVCAGGRCGPAIREPFCVVPTYDASLDPNYVPQPFDCPGAFKAKPRMR
jgi:hypothetical protein